MFRRKRSDDDFDAVDETADQSPAGVAAGPRADGPWDAAEIDLEQDPGSRMDLGGLLVPPQEHLDLQLQVDEASGQVVAVVLAGEEGAVELRPFAAPRNGDIWDDVRRQVSAEVARMGGTATEVEGPYGTALKVSLSVNRPDGSSGTQVSQVLGIPGPRWLLRATLFGRPALDYRPDGDVETALRSVVVVRGSGPVPPGDPLPLTVPPNAQRIEG
jgi:hypothetical protein